MLIMYPSLVGGALNACVQPWRSGALCFFLGPGSISAELVIVTYLMQGRVHVEDVVR